MSKHPSVSYSEFEGVRYLHLGETPWVQGAMNLRTPRSLELEYVQRMMAWMLWRPTPELAAGHAVQLGLGAASMTRFCHQVLRFDKVTAVELNPTVIAACRHAFRLPADSERLQVVCADAGDWVADNARAASVQVLNVDLYDQEAAAPVLDSLAFYANCRRVLAPGGVMTVNLFGRHASFAESARKIVSAFGSPQAWCLRPTKEGNTVVVATVDVTVPGRDELTARADTIERRTGLPARKWLRMVRPISELIP
jgi:spermidine synthase